MRQELVDILHKGTIHPGVGEMITRLSSKEPIGVGTRSVVYDYPGNPNRVMSFVHTKYEFDENSEAYPAEDLEIPPAEVKARGYLSKLLNILAPGIVPHVYLAGSRPPVLVLEKIHTDPKPDFVGNPNSHEYQRELEDRRQTVYKAIEPINQVLRDFGIGYDDYNVLGNYLRNKEGNYVYVGKLDFSNVDLAKMHDAVSKLNADKQKEAKRVLERFEKFIAEMPKIPASEQGARI